MAMSCMGVFTLLMAMLSGGAAELLDFTSTEAYWKAKGVNVSLDQLLTEIKAADGAADATALIRTLGAGTFQDRDKAAQQLLKLGPAIIPQLEKAKDDPDAEVSNRASSLIQQIRVGFKAHNVRKLMAIRTLGEMKKAEALPALKALLDSKEQFVARYAADAIAAIEGKPLAARTLAAEVLKSDVSILPANCGAVGQVSTQAGKKLAMDQILKQMPPTPGQDPKQIVEMVSAQVIAIADQIGNARIDALTFGVSEKIGNSEGFVIFIVRGEFDAKAAGPALQKAGVVGEAIDGVDVYRAEVELTFFFPSDDRAILLMGPAPDKVPVKEMIAAARQSKGGLMTNPAIAKLIGKVDPKAGAWAVVNVTDSYRQTPVFAAFNDIIMTGRQEPGQLNIDIQGNGTDAKQVESAVNIVNGGLDQARQQLPQMTQAMPFLKPVADFVGTIKCEAKGPSAGLTAQFKGEAASLMMLPAMMFGMAAREAPPVQVGPAVIEKVAPEAQPAREPAKEAVPERK